MRKLLIIALLFLTSCATTFKIGTYTSDITPTVYDSNGNPIEVVVIENDNQLRKLLRNDFQFRYNLAQYALSQPESFDWNNRLLYNRSYRNNMYNWGYGYRNSWGYSSMWNRSQMWNDWVWNYPYGNGMGWSYSWRNNRWSSNSWYGMGNVHSGYGWNGWSNGYGYNSWHQVGGIYGRRMSIQDRRGIAAMGNSRISRETTAVIHGNNNTRVRVKRTNVKPPVVIVKPPRRRTIITPIRSNNNNRNNNNNIRINNNTNRNNNTRINTNRNNNTRINTNTRSTNNTRSTTRSTGRGGKKN